MGTPPALSSLDQMRRIQMSANGAGKCAAFFALENTPACFVAARGSVAIAIVEGKNTMFCWSDPGFASGCTGGTVFFCDVWQQALFAQHPNSHAFSLTTVDTVHAAAGSFIGAIMSAIATITAKLILLRITLLRSTISVTRRTLTRLLFARSAENLSCRDAAVTGSSRDLHYS